MNEVMVASREVSLVDITPEQVELIKRTVAKGATQDELELYFYDCKRRGIHPLDKKLYFTKRKDKDGTHKYTPLVAIDFIRELGHATGECVGVSDPVFSGTPGKPDFQATVTVKRLVKGVVAEFTATARWAEYCPAHGQDFMWQRMKHTMLGKCAEALAWRKGFAGGKLTDLHIVEEFDQEREQEVSLSAAMTQDFPPNTPLIGLFKELVPANDTKPAIAMIEVDGVGTMGFDLLKDPAYYSPLLSHFVEFQYGRNGKFRPITSMVLAPTAVQAPLKAVPGPVRTPKAVKGEEASKYEPPPSVDESGEPPTEAYFEAAKDCIGLVIKVEPKSSRDGSKKWHVLTFACVNGDYQATVWSQSELGFADINEVLNKQVWFRVWEKEYRGAMQYTVEMLELYNTRQTQEEANV